MKLNKLRCKLFGHKWRYNFSCLASKAICERCHQKSKFNTHTLEWEEVKGFEGDNRSDEELVKKWIP